jgi:hypothetical protein
MDGSGHGGLRKVLLKPVQKYVDPGHCKPFPQSQGVTRVQATKSKGID